MTSPVPGEQAGRPEPASSRPLPEFRDIVDVLLRLGLLGFLLYLCLRIVAPFSTIIAWGVILAVAFHPFHLQLAVRLGGRPKTAATLIAVVLLAIPIALVAVISDSVAAGAVGVKAALASGQVEVPQLGQKLSEWSPAAGRLLQPFLDDVAKHSQAVLSWLVPHLRTLAGALAGAVGRRPARLCRAAQRHEPPARERRRRRPWRRFPDPRHGHDP
jgi:predicted PurR-regulated permease PerM